MHKKRKIPLAVLIFGGVFLVVLIIFANLSAIKREIQNFSLFRPTPTPLSKYSFHSVPPPLPTGKQTYNVSHGGNPEPNISQVTIDNYDPKKGEKQTYSIKVSGSLPVFKVQLTITTDYKTKVYEAKLAEGKTATDGVWEAVVPTEDSHDYVYRALVEAFDAQDKSSVTITIR